MEILLILLLLAAPSVPSLAPLLSALAAIPQAAQGSTTPQSPAPQAQNAAMQPTQNSAAPSPQGEEGQLLASLLQLFRPQEERGEGGAPQDTPGLFAQLLQLFSAPREQGEKNAPQEAALAALLRQLTEFSENTKPDVRAAPQENAAANTNGPHEGKGAEACEDPLAPIRAIAPADALRRLAEALQSE